MLSRFQEQWEHIHSESEANAKKAQVSFFHQIKLYYHCLVFPVRDRSNFERDCNRRGGVDSKDKLKKLAQRKLA